MKSSYKRLNYRPLIVALTLVIGCAEDLVPDGGSGADGPKVQSTDNGDGTFTTTIDASADDQWVYLSLTDGAHVTPADPDDSASWDLAFQRFRVKSNSGISGVAGVEVAPILGADFDALTQAPARGYVVDAVDSDDEDTDADYAFLGPSPWYDYDSEQHTLSPANVVYVVKSVAGSYFKVQMQGYYDAAGTGGYPRFRWGPVEAPPVVQGPYPDAYVIDATEEDEWRYVDILTGTIIGVDDPAKSSDWDIAVSGMKLRTNGGTSGAGLGGSMAWPGADWDSVTTSPVVGFVIDGPIEDPSGTGKFSGNPVLSDWFEKDPETQEPSPKDTLFLVRTADGAYAKMRVLAYSDGALTIETEELDRQVEVYREVIEAPQADHYVYFDFDLGTIVDPADPTSSLAWDLGISGTKMQTNGGTSGSGQGAALDPGASTLAEIVNAPNGSGCYLLNQGHVCVCEMSETECATEGEIWTPQCECPTPFVDDELLTLPEVLGADEYSGSPVLANWYDYDVASDTTTPKVAAFILRTAEGGFVKFQVIAHNNGVLSFDWAYAGHGESTF